MKEAEHEQRAVRIGQPAEGADEVVDAEFSEVDEENKG